MLANCYKQFKMWKGRGCGSSQFQLYKGNWYPRSRTPDARLPRRGSPRSRGTPARASSRRATARRTTPRRTKRSPVKAEADFPLYCHPRCSRYFRPREIRIVKERNSASINGSPHRDSPRVRTAFSLCTAISDAGDVRPPARYPNSQMCESGVTKRPGGESL